MNIMCVKNCELSVSFDLAPQRAFYCLEKLQVTSMTRMSILNTIDLTNFALSSSPRAHSLTYSCRGNFDNDDDGGEEEAGTFLDDFYLLIIATVHEFYDSFICT